MSDLIEKFSVPRVGLGVLVLRDGKCLLAKRWDADGSFVWCFPGGHLEYGETIEQGVRRETLEEAGIEIGDIKLCLTGNLGGFAPKHYAIFGVATSWKSGELRDEEGKMTNWCWFDVDALPSPMYRPSKLLLDAYLSGETRFIDETPL